MIAPRWVLAFGCLTSMALPARAAHADAIQVCADAYTKGQEERLAGRLLSARTLFQTCADPSCPAAVVPDCQRWVTEVEADLPSAVIKVIDTAGRVPTGLSVFLDGQSVPLDALGKPYVLSPGPHVLRVEAPGYQPLELDPALRPEDRQLPINALLRFAPISAPVAAPEPSTAQQSPSKPVPVAAIAFASVGAVALGTSLYFGLSAKSRYDDLKSECAPSCAQSQIDTVNSKALVSDIALGTSLVAFGAAAYFLFSAKSDAGAPRAAALRIEPTPRGASARLQLAF